MSDENERQEIIIIRRGGGGEEGHHGGAWKIAFADFMTAMMALFLVLWLVNASNEETKKAVASYFNPVKLVDRNRSSKGLQEAEGLETKNKEQDAEKPGGGNGEDTDEPVKGAESDSELFRDPFKVLDQIASRESDKMPATELALEASTSSGLPSEEAFLDPFAQVSGKPSEEVNTTVVAEQNQNKHSVKLEIIDDNAVRARPVKFEVADGVEGRDPKKADGESEKEPKEVKKADGKPEMEHAESKGKDKPKDLKEEEPSKEKPANGKKMEAQNEQASDKEEPTVLEKAEKLDKREAELRKKTEEMKRLAREIGEEIKKRLKGNLDIDKKLSESLIVEATDDGVLISITDQLGFSMFQVGSALPRGQLVLAMDQISTVLGERGGAVRVYGHTDARPYGDGGDYDNWRLSTARAHAARYMLLRGGLAGQRIGRVTGFADRNLRLPDDPNADANRRIEILLEVS